MLNDKITRTTETYGLMILLYAKEKNDKKMETTFKEGLKLALGPKENLFDAIIQGYITCRLSHEANSTFHEMLDMNMTPSDKTISKYIHFLGLNNQNKDLNNLMDLL